MKKLLIIKLGGSVVTYKNSSKPKARIKIINRLAQEIKQILDTNKYKIILVHGAGSFGHPLAKRYKLQYGMQTQDQKFGFGLTTQKMIDLNSIIVSTLLKNGVPATSLPPHAFITQSAGKLKQLDYSTIKAYLAQEIIPILYGDAVYDDRWNCSIISGDAIVSYLAKKMKADKVIFLSDVDGIFTADPNKYKHVKPIPEINNKNFKEVLKGLTPMGRDDVSGEMRGKILEIRNNLRLVNAVVIGGLKSGNLTKAVHQSPVGTLLRFE